MYKVAGVQMNSIMGDVETNIDRGLKYLEKAVEQEADIVVFPELWTTGYYLSKGSFEDLAEKNDGRTISLMQSKARECNVVIICPFAEVDNKGHLFISVAIINNDGTVTGFHRKALLWGREKDIFNYGELSFPVFDTEVGKIGVLICYEAEFPETARLLALEGAEIIIVPSMWSLSGAIRWDVQIPARALDNTVYVLGVNNIGNNACGKSKLVNPWGKIIIEASDEMEDMLISTVDEEAIQWAREEIPYIEDFKYRLTPGGIPGGKHIPTPTV